MSNNKRLYCQSCLKAKCSTLIRKTKTVPVSSLTFANYEAIKSNPLSATSQQLFDLAYSPFRSAQETEQVLAALTAAITNPSTSASDVLALRHARANIQGMEMSYPTN